MPRGNEKLSGGEALESRILLSATWADFDGDPVEFDGDVGDDNFDLSSLTNGGFYSVHGGDGSDEIDLDQVDLDQVTWRDGGMLIDLGDGESARIDFDGVESITFGDTTATVLSSGTHSDSSFDGESTFVDGDTVFSIETTSNGSFDVSYDTSSDTLHVHGSSGTDADTDLTITSAGPNDLNVGTISIDGEVDAIHSDVDIETIEFSTDAVVGSIEVDAGEGRIGTIRIEGSLQSPCQINGNIDLFEADSIEGALTIHGDVGQLDCDGDLQADLEISGDINEIRIGGELQATVTAQHVEGAITIEYGGETYTQDLSAESRVEISCDPATPDQLSVRVSEAFATAEDASLAWSFDGIGSTTEPDLVSGTEAEFYGGVSRIPAGEGAPTEEAIHLDGVDDYVDLGDQARTTLGGTATVSVWVRTEGCAGEGDSVWRWPSIIGTEQCGGVQDLRWGAIDSDGKVRLSIGNSTGVGSAVAINDGEWHQIVLSRNANTGLCQVYVDGVLSGEGTAQTGDISMAAAHLGQTNDDNGVYDIHLEADFAGLQIFDHVLDAQEVADSFAEAGAEAVTLTLGAEGSVVTLDPGDAYDPANEAISYSWVQRSGPEVTLDDPTARTPTFTVPEGLDDYEISFELVVSEGTDSTTETITVAAMADNDGPTAIAGSDITVQEGELVTLDAGASTDPELAMQETLDLDPSLVQSHGGPNQDLGGTAEISDDGSEITLSGNTWKSIPWSGEVSENSTLTLEFRSSSPGEIQGIGFDNDAALSEDRMFHLAGSQNWGIQDWDRISIEELEDGWQRITIPVGERYTGDFDRLVFINDMDAGGTPPECSFRNVVFSEQGTLTYTWQQVGGPSVAIPDASGQQLAFVAPEGVSNTELVFEVTVSDGTSTSTDMVTVIVEADDDAPIANAGEDLSAEGGDEVRLDGSNSSDPEFDSVGSIRFEESLVLSHGGASQDVSGSVEILDDGRGMALEGNTWKALPWSGEIGEDSVLSFEFRSTADGEIQGIGFDRDGQLSEGYSFKLGGSQNWGIQDYVLESGDDGWQRVEIRVGEHFTGDFDRIVFINDQDAGSDPVECAFRDLSIRSAADVAETLNYEWRQVAGPTVTLDDPYGEQPVFVAPDLASDTELVFELHVSDGTSTSVDTVRVTLAGNGSAAEPAAQPETPSESETLGTESVSPTTSSPEAAPTSVAETQPEAPTPFVTLTSPLTAEPAELADAESSSAQEAETQPVTASESSTPQPHAQAALESDETSNNESNHEAEAEAELPTRDSTIERQSRPVSPAAYEEEARRETQDADEATIQHDVRGVEIEDSVRTDSSETDSGERQGFLGRVLLGLFHLLGGSGGDSANRK